MHISVNNSTRCIVRQSDRFFYAKFRVRRRVRLIDELNELRLLLTYTRTDQIRRHPPTTTCPTNYADNRRKGEIHVEDTAFKRQLNHSGNLTKWAPRETGENISFSNDIRVGVSRAKT